MIDMRHTICQLIVEGLPLSGGWISLAHEGMVEDRELVTLMLGTAALLMALRYRQTIAAVPGIKWWAAALIARMVSWVNSILEAILWQDLCNLLEHLLLSVSTVLIAIGCWSTFAATTREKSA